MSMNLPEIASDAFAELVASDDVEISTDVDECQIVSDDWTLVLGGDPLTSVIIALDDEDGDAEGLLRDAISEEEFAAMRELDSTVSGQISQLLAGSTDTLANALARILTT